MKNKEIILETLTYEPQKQIDLCKQLWIKGIFINPRMLRRYINELNRDFIDDKSEFVIISNANGTYKSELKEDIIKFNQSKIKHAKSELWSAYNINKRIASNNQISFKEYIEMELNDGNQANV